MRIEIQGKIVEVDDSFANLPPDQQQATVDEIANSMAPQEKGMLGKTAEFFGTTETSPLFGGAVGTIGGIAAGPVISGATQAVRNAKPVAAPTPAPVPASAIPPEVVARGPHAVENWTRTQHAGQFHGGTDYAEAHQRALKVKEALAKTPGYSAVGQTGIIVPTDAASEFEAKQAAKQAAANRSARSVGQKIAQAPFTRGAQQAIQGAAASLPAWLGRGIAGGSAGMQGVDAANRFREGDILGGTISGLGALGSGAALIPHPLTRGVGTAVGTVAPFLNELIDRARKPQPQQTAMAGDANAMPMAAGGAIRGYSDGGNPRTMVAKAGLNALKKAFVPSESKLVKLSEGLAPVEGGKLRVTQADRMRVGDGMKGGSGFSGLQLVDPEHAAREAAWMVDAKGAGTALARSALEYPNTVFSNVLAKPTAHHSNRQVFGDMRDEYFKLLDQGLISPEWAESANKIIPKLTVGKEKKPMFSQPFDVRDKFAVQELVDTFDRRGALAEMFSGKGTGGKKGALPFYSRIIESYSDPLTKDAQTFSVGNRLFTLTGEAPEYVTDLHPAYDWLLKGKDLGVHFEPVPQEIALPDFYNFMVKEKGMKPGTFHYTRGYPRSQDITEEYLTRLQKEGFAEGGATR